MIVRLKGGQVRLPDFLIVGAAKCGTTSLYYYLSQHPQVYMSPVKEPFFFTIMGDEGWKGDDAAVTSLDDYMRLFASAGAEQIAGEASTSYLHGARTTIDNIKAVYGDDYRKIKIIGILRDPVARALSHYNYFLKLCWEDAPFVDAVTPQRIEARKGSKQNYDYIGGGMYYDKVKRYMDEFPETRFFLFDDLKSSAAGLVRQIEDFLSIETNVEIDTSAEVNPSGMPKSRLLANVLVGKGPVMNRFKRMIPASQRQRLANLRDSIWRKVLVKAEVDEGVKEHLRTVYREDILKLQQLLGRDLSRWLGE